jgi:hypothetical protein
MRRDIELVIRRLLRAPAFLLATLGTLTLGLGMFAVVYTAVQKIVIEPMPYRNPQPVRVMKTEPHERTRRGRFASSTIVSSCFAVICSKPRGTAHVARQ